MFILLYYLDYLITMMGLIKILIIVILRKFRYISYFQSNGCYRHIECDMYIIISLFWCSQFVWFTTVVETKINISLKWYCALPLLLIFSKKFECSFVYYKKFWKFHVSLLISQRLLDKMKRNRLIGCRICLGR